MKNFWHIQLHPNNKSEFPREKIRRILEDTHFIGMGEWEEGKVYIDQFRNVMRIGDIVLVRSQGPLALVEVVGAPEKTPNANVDFDWFENRRLVRILQFFDEKIESQIGKNVDGIFNTVTFASANTSEFIKKWFSLYSKSKMLDLAKALLQYKKQIILQGPPGTGKTRLAKEIANQLCGSQEMTIDFIRAAFKEGMEVLSSSGSKKYWVESLDDIGVTLKLESGSVYRIPYSGIIDSFEKRLWKGGMKNNLDSYRAALAKYLFEKSGGTGEMKLIQFHPAYSYEDFVRGIVVDSTDGIVSYRSVDRVFAELAQKAWQNYQDSKKSPEQLSKEKEVDKYMELFRDHLEDQIETNNGKFLLEGTTTYLFQVEGDAVRYTGDNWKLTTGQRLLFSDIKTLFLSGANSRKDVKSNPGVSGLAKQHSSYFVRVLNLFKEFVNGQSVSSFEKTTVEQQNFVLIIDEINRANLPSVLGELIYGLEYRGESVESMYEVDGDRSIVIPPNLYVIGTMNTADRSVGHIDYAIRRRFAFVDVHPSDQPIREVVKDAQTQAKALELFQKVSALFHKEYLNSDFKAEEVQLGHSYFLAKDEATLKLKLDFEIKPLLKEYVKDGILNEKAAAVIEKL
ncbi:AAA family ATPase [Algoriphagus marincola]|uniref:AAA family ATPase n=1 Tax=Algoriphagus marincola TaxID=264027 RepID=A0ABS7N2L2_9BACT|nr:AAA family ATPase [Algoriphagus marincola]MBY5950542.1 AAA family ATPase [Algoriphagus marincola]